MAQEGFPSPYGPVTGYEHDVTSMDEVRYGAPGSTPVVEGEPCGYVPFTYPDAEDTPELLAGGSMQPPEDPPRILVDSDGEDHGRRLNIVSEDGGETTLEIIDD